MLSELRRVEERLQPFIQRAHTILETATTAEYNNNTVGFKLPNNNNNTFVILYVVKNMLGAGVAVT